MQYSPRMTTTAPVFGNTTYPMGGKRLAPAWQAAWDLLQSSEPGAYLDKRELVDAMTGASEILPETAASILWRAQQHGLLTSVKRRKDKASRLFYRLAEQK